MSIASNIDFKSAADAYAVANTPLFLLRKLREDSAVAELASRFSGECILTALAESLKEKPKTLEEYVQPYAYLTALSMVPDRSFLDRAVSLDGSGSWEWFRYLHRVLAESDLPTSFAVVRVKSPQRATTWSDLARSSSSTEVSRIDLGKR